MNARRNRSQMCQIQVLVDGRVLPVLSDNAGNRWVESELGKEFVVRVHTPNMGRHKVVAAVDGLSVMDAEPSDGSCKNVGYVVEPGQNYIDIPGYRLDDDEVAHFYFTEPGESYAAKRGHTDNNGVIGVNIFAEDRPRPRYPRRPRRVYSTGSKSLLHDFDRYGGELELAGESRGRSDHGAGFGRKTKHEVVKTEFKAIPQPIAQLVLRFASEKRLIEMGIKRPKDDLAKPFPAKQDVGCPPPAGWQG